MFDDRLRLTRMARGFIQQQMADTLKIDVRRYQKYESGHVKIPLDILVDVADILDVPTDFLLCRDDYLKMRGVVVDVSLDAPPRRPRPRRPIDLPVDN